MLTHHHQDLVELNWTFAKSWLHPGWGLDPIFILPYNSCFSFGGGRCGSIYSLRKTGDPYWKSAAPRPGELGTEKDATKSPFKVWGRRMFSQVERKGLKPTNCPVRWRPYIQTYISFYTLNIYIYIYKTCLKGIWCSISTYNAHLQIYQRKFGCETSELRTFKNAQSNRFVK